MAWRARVEPADVTLALLDLLPFNAVDAGPTHDHVDLLLPGIALVMLRPRHSGRHLEPVDPERLCAERTANEADRPARPFRRQVVHVHDAVPHSHLLTSER